MPPIDPNNPQIPNVRPITRAPAEPLDSTPYDFIMNPKVQPPKKTPGLRGGPKLTYIAGGGVVLVILVFLVLSFTGGGSSNPSLVKIAQQQTELARVVDLHYSDLRDSTTKNFVINAELSVISAQATYLQYLAQNGVGIDEKQLALGTNGQTDTVLDAAMTSGTIDSTVKTTVKDSLLAYQSTIQTAYKNSSSPATKALLTNMFDDVAILLEQADAK